MVAIVTSMPVRKTAHVTVKANVDNAPLSTTTSRLASEDGVQWLGSPVSATVWRPVPRVSCTPPAVSVIGSPSLTVTWAPPGARVPPRNREGDGELTLGGSGGTGVGAGEQSGKKGHTGEVEEASLHGGMSDRLLPGDVVGKGERLSPCPLAR